jgi:hypothetical protein
MIDQSHFEKMLSADTFLVDRETSTASKGVGFWLRALNDCNACGTSRLIMAAAA